MKQEYMNREYIYLHYITLYMNREYTFTILPRIFGGPATYISCLHDCTCDIPMHLTATHTSTLGMVPKLYYSIFHKCTPKSFHTKLTFPSWIPWTYMLAHYHQPTQDPMPSSETVFMLQYIRTGDVMLKVDDNFLDINECMYHKMSACINQSTVQFLHRHLKFLSIVEMWSLKCEVHDM